MRAPGPHDFIVDGRLPTRLFGAWLRDVTAALLGLRLDHDTLASTLPVQMAVATAAPVAGTWARGAIVWNSEPSAGGFIGWVCVVAGTPGTWEAWGAIES